MPELPDLVYIENELREHLLGRTIRAVRVFEPVVLRVALPGGFAEALAGARVTQLHRRGPFLVVSVPPLEMIVHFMLAGRFAVYSPGAQGTPGRRGRSPGGAPGGSPDELPGSARRRGKGHCFSLHLEGDLELAYHDDRRMGRVYLVRGGETREIPGFGAQGVDVLSEGFTLPEFQRLIRGRRQQVRVFLMDQSALSAIGNAYADEILFAAGVHPKTGCHQLGSEDLERLYASVGTVLRAAIAAVRSAGRPIEEKVRDHVKVRGRHGSPCPVCGTTIRRTGVLGYDSFFCPRCQPAVKPGAIRWDRLPGGPDR